MAKYLMLNGDMLPTDKPCLMCNNRGFLFGDSFGFKLRGNSSQSFFIDEYFDYLLFALKQMRMDRTFILRKSLFITDLELLMQKNRIYKGFSADVRIFRNSDKTNNCSVLVVPDALPNEFYAQPNKGWSVLVHKKFALSEYDLASHISPTYSEEFFIAADIVSTGIDDFLLCDNDGRIIRSTNSSVFFVKEGNLILPTKIPNNSEKVFIDIVIKEASEIGIPVVRWEVKEKDLYDLDEIFLANIIDGIVPVMAFKEKRYYNKMSLKLLKKINESVAIQIR